jgi:hypothetical protein
MPAKYAGNKEGCEAATFRAIAEPVKARHRAADITTSRKNADSASRRKCAPEWRPEGQGQITGAPATARKALASPTPQ